jgi:pimeloyl-ACP methyl ester carboxylesterase
VRVPPAGLICALALLAPGAPASAAPLQFHPCTGTPDYECATLDVPLDPTGGHLDRLRLHVRRLVETREAEEVLVALAGGPGQSSTRFVDDFADVLAEGLENRQLVVLDQRGTGHSGPLDCRALESVPPTATVEALLPRVGRCGRQLGDTRRFFTTTEVVEDLEALRIGLGVERLSIFGISYGSYVAQRYARRYPARVDRLVLDSPVAQDQGGAFDRSSYSAVGPVLRRLCAARRCRGITRDPVADLRVLVGKLREGPLRGRVFDSRGRARALRLRAQEELFDLLVSSDFSPVMRGALPAALRSAVRGDEAPLLRLLAIDNGTADSREFDEQNEDPAEFSNALFFATTCQEKPLPWGAPDASLSRRRARRQAALAELPSDAFFPFGAGAADSTQLGTVVCERWPSTRVVPVPDPGPIDAPALVLSGLMDLRTPAAEARRTAALISDASLVTVPGAGHSLVSSRLGCVQTALTRFFADQAVGNPCAGPPSRALAPDLAPLAPRRLERRPQARLRGHGARLASAVLDTLRDAVRMVAAQGLLDRGFTFGGLRGGSACARPGEAGGLGRRSLVLEFDGYAYVPGLEATGRAAIRAGKIVRMSLASSGRRALRGRLQLHGRRLSGRMGRRRVAVRVPRPALSVTSPAVAASLAPEGWRRCR